MRKRTLWGVLLLAAISFMLTPQNSQATTLLKAAKLALSPTFKWTTTVVDFGTITQNSPKTATFEFTNVGNSPLIISSATGSCGCTVADYTREPVPFNGKGRVTATYNAAAVGAFNKTVTVTANVPEGTITLTIKGEVVAAK
ncbi:MAG: DUF1573 domain-containing protein [Cytophagales bacterium]|nr:MAG: DUF1573 domain-containing protein [Cytophagales bacterium]